MSPCGQNPKRERWRPVPGYEHLYEVSSWGRVRRLGGDVVLRPTRDKDGYEYCTLCTGGGQRSFLVHRLVVAAFIRQFAPGEETNHKDGNKTNNHASNLELVTHQQNMDHAVRMGLICRGENSPQAVLTEDDVREIRRLHVPGRCRAGGMGCKALAKEFGVSPLAVYRVIKRRTWRHVD
jgi:hypothetical protein